VTIFEARAWCTSLSNGYLLQSKPMQSILTVLEKYLLFGECYCLEHTYMQDIIPGHAGEVPLAW